MTDGTFVPNKWVGLNELADYLGVGRNTIRRHVDQGRIPFIRVGHQYRFDVYEVVAAYREGVDE